MWRLGSFLVLALALTGVAFYAFPAIGYVPAKPVYVYVDGCWASSPNNGVVTLKVNVKYYATVPALGGEFSLTLPAGLSNLTGGDTVEEGVTAGQGQGEVSLDVPLYVRGVPVSSVLNFTGFVNWTVVVDNQTTYYVTPFSFSLTYYGEPYISVYPVASSLKVGENIVTFVVNRNQVPVYSLKVWVNSESLNLSPQAVTFNASLFVPLQFYLSLYPVEVRAYYLTPYGYSNFSETYYLLVNDTQGTPLRYAVVSSPNPYYLAEGKNLLEVELTNVLGTPLRDVYVDLVVGNGSAMKHLIYLPQWGPNQTFTYSLVVYASGQVAIGAYVFNDSGNITELGTVDVPFAQNLTALSFFYNLSDSSLTLFSNLPVEMENVSVDGHHVGSIRPYSFASLRENASLVNVTYYVEGVPFHEAVELEPQALSLNYTLLDGRLTIFLKDELGLQVSNVVVVVPSTNQTYTVGQIQPNAQVTLTIQGNATSAVPVEVRYAVNSVEYFSEYELKVTVPLKVPVLRLEKYQVTQNGNTFTLLLYIKNIGNTSPQDGYLLVSSNSVTSLYPQVIPLSQLGPGQIAITYVYASSNFYKFNVTASLVWSNGSSVFNKSYLIVVVNNNVDPVIKYLSIGIDYLGYSVYDVPITFIAVMATIMALILLPRRGKKRA
ncbi:MAG: hypothetical protein MPF33_10765 [Candidatus Aramenus sp.]|jgi:hypothetical protein|nr:hypothetical protein [Candidatus Aramenus sp.]